MEKDLQVLQNYFKLSSRAVRMREDSILTCLPEDWFWRKERSPFTQSEQPQATWVCFYWHSSKTLNDYYR